MPVVVRRCRETDIPSLVRIWNEVVEEGVAFPQLDILDEREGLRFFSEQTWCAAAEETESGKILGLYILHPNNVGRCGHLANASFAVSGDSRGAHVGEKLVTDCLRQAAECGFRVMQFNAVVKTNAPARHLYEKLGFTQLGEIPEGFLMKDGRYEDICLYYKTL
jgi:L-amino acid N-acyltransferase YncA